MSKVEIIKTILMKDNIEIHPDKDKNIMVKGTNNSNEMELSEFLTKISKAIDKVK